MFIVTTKWVIEQVMRKVFFFLASKSKMFEARMTQGSVLRKLIEAIRELVSNVNFEVSSNSFELQVPPPTMLSSSCELRQKFRKFLAARIAAILADVLATTASIEGATAQVWFSGGGVQWLLKVRQT